MMEPQPQHRTDSVQASSEISEKERVASVPNMRELFHSMDNPAVLQQSMQALAAPTSRNFVLDFGDEHAHVAFDLEPPTIETLLRSTRQDTLSTRWINLWYPFHQRSVLEVLGQHYDFSPRLLALMCADPRRPTRTTDLASYAIAAEHGHALSDLESGSSSTTSTGRQRSHSTMRRRNLYDIVDEVWHYSSIDQGRSYLCLGFNSLYSVGHLVPEPQTSDQRSEDEQIHTPLPHVRRVWTWLLLLSDSTVITITEDLFPYSSGYLTPVENAILLRSRRNLINVFRSISKVEMNFQNRTPLTLLPIRRRLGETPEETVHRSSDAPGLLFYYLFENWENSYSLVTRKESRYGMELQRVRKEMFKSPKLTHIDRLDQIGNQLMVLKRHYKSYLRLIDRVIEPQKASLASLTNSRIASKNSKESLFSPGYASLPAHGTVFGVSTRTGQPMAHGVTVPGTGEADMMVDAESLLGVSISSAARVRFERLRDVIGLYALSECTDYLQQKESLVQMVCGPIFANAPRHLWNG